MIKKKKMTIKEMYEWLEARGCILAKRHKKGELEAFINYYCRVSNKRNPLEDTDETDHSNENGTTTPY